MDTFLDVMRIRIYTAAENCFGIYWPEWRRPVEDLILYCDTTGKDCEELKQAKDEAIRAHQSLQEVTKATLRKIQKEICDAHPLKADVEHETSSTTIQE